ncbi:MAG: ATP-binding cassette domain-containing protein [Candidatus Cloacimonetes bacterium]|nr:ATP-binding cassette domain-containing protein [Candidatus Cloacimonadota bacterium]
MIEVIALNKSFEQKDGEALKAVCDLSFSAAAGEIVVLLGVNGAGKTTTMRMLSTVLKPSSGTATICGYELLQESALVRASLGFLSGDTGLYHRLTARELITYFGRLYDMKDSLIRQRITRFEEILNMGEFLDKRVENLSTGMKQKVSIARSIIHDPPVIIFDEATAGLDILTAKNIMNFIHSCRDEGKCVLFSTHIMREAERIADRIVMIHEGRLIREATWLQMQDETGKRDLDDIFIEYVNSSKKPAEESADELE